VNFDRLKKQYDDSLQKNQELQSDLKALQKQMDIKPSKSISGNKEMRYDDLQDNDENEDENDGEMQEGSIVGSEEEEKQNEDDYDGAS
jgi:hypothetical protein